MTPVPIRSLVHDALQRSWDAAVESRGLPPFPEGESRPTIEVQRPAQPEHGDLASNLALKLARPYKRSPFELATLLAAKLVRDAAENPESPIDSVVVAPPGLLNLRLSDRALEGMVDGILQAPADWGHVTPERPRSVNVEFVSANPTGPLTIGNARGAFVGDLLSRVLAAGGQTVTREYYFNDSGAQVSHLGASVVAIRQGRPVPEEGYKGAYVEDLGRELPDDIWAAATAPGADAADVVGRWAAGRVRSGIETSLEHLGVHFDVWTSEARLHEEGWVDRAVARLKERGHVYELDGALWFR